MQRPELHLAQPLCAADAVATGKRRRGRERQSAEHGFGLSARYWQFPALTSGSRQVEEQMRGWLARLNRLTTPPQLADWYDFLVQRMFPPWRRYDLLPFPEPAILRFEQLKTLRLNVGLMDLRLAALALESNLTIVTRNQRDFGRVPGVVTEDWSM